MPLAMRSPRGWTSRLGLLGVVGLIATPVLILLFGRGGDARGVWPVDDGCFGGIAAEGGWFSGLGFLSNYGSYMPRTDCMVTATGETDWAWVWALVVLNLVIIAGYLRIFAFWRRAYKAEEARDRNDKLMHLAWMFLLCAACGYVSSIVLFVWPVYRLLGLLLVPLAYVTWRFAWNLDGFRSALSVKRLERELRESLERRNEELERLVAAATEELVAAKVEAERANEAKSGFLANMSHEIRTPMTAIIGYTDLLMDGGCDAADRESFTRTIHRNGTHLLSLINDILDLSKIESGRIEFERTGCDPGEIVREVVELLGPRARDNNVRLGAEIDPSVHGTVTTDPTRLRQIVTNLVGNAIKFSAHGTVTVRVFPGASGDRRPGSDGTLVFEVEDSGIGMTPEQQARCFDAFSQADASTTRRFGGTGLGLSIARKLARLLGGDIVVRSSPGNGSVFTAWIDAGADTGTSAGTGTGADAGAGTDSGPSDAARAIRPLDRTHHRTALRGKRVLLVEDEADSRRLIRFHLLRAGATVEIATNGREALAAFRAPGAAYDLVLMDMQMPVMDGREAAIALRAMGVTTPMIALTADALEPGANGGPAPGFDARVTKPVDFGQLIELCRRLGADDAGRNAA